ncbi:MAG: molybdenum cofactor guanylyltransferase [Erythrobacter sp.]
MLAGGKARRFGSDKAHALVGGMRLIDRVADRLAQQSDAVIVCGREEAGFACVADMPEADMGPLGGLNAALAYAENQGFDAVLSAPCDVPELPEDLHAQLADGVGQTPDHAIFVADQPVVGLWPTALRGTLSQYVSDGGRALYGFTEMAGARGIALRTPLANINRPEDLP